MAATRELHTKHNVLNIFINVKSFGLFYVNYNFCAKSNFVFTFVTNNHIDSKINDALSSIVSS